MQPRITLEYADPMRFAVYNGRLYDLEDAEEMQEYCTLTMMMLLNVTDDNL